jgi:plasmid stability protein
MKTTIDIPDPLLKRLRQRAARDGTTMRALIHAALQSFLSGSPRRATDFTLRDGSFNGDGPAVDPSDWSVIRERAYEGRGGEKDAAG